jgi:hypothetical protein
MKPDQHPSRGIEVPSETYYENGQLRQKGTDVAGRRDGLWEMYYENGQLEEKGTFNMGVKCGEWIEEGEARTHPLALFDGNPTPPCPPDLEDDN